MHVTEEMLLAYFESRLPEESVALIEEHLADCKECGESGRIVFRFHNAWEHWNAKTHGEAVVFHQALLRHRVAVALRRAEVQEAKNPAMRERFHAWRQKFQGKAGGALRVALNVPHEVSRIVTEGMESILGDSPNWQFAYDLGPTRTHGTEARQMEYLVVTASGTPDVEVSIDKEANEIFIKFPEADIGTQMPLVVLVPENGGNPLVASRPTRPVGGKHIELRFKALLPGKYTLVFEPME